MAEVVVGGLFTQNETLALDGKSTACTGPFQAQLSHTSGFFLTVLTISVNIYETNWNDVAEEQHTDIVFAYFVILSPLILQRTAVCGCIWANLYSFSVPKHMISQALFCLPLSSAIRDPTL